MFFVKTRKKNHSSLLLLTFRGTRSPFIALGLLLNSVCQEKYDLGFPKFCFFHSNVSQVNRVNRV